MFLNVFFIIVCVFILIGYCEIVDFEFGDIVLFINVCGQIVYVLVIYKKFYGCFLIICIMLDGEICDFCIIVYYSFMIDFGWMCVF